MEQVSIPPEFPMFDIIVLSGITIIVLAIFYWRSKRVAKSIKDIAQEKQDLDAKIAQMQARSETTTENTD